MPLVFVDDSADRAKYGRRFPHERAAFFRQYILPEAELGGAHTSIIQTFAEARGPRGAEPAMAQGKAGGVFPWSEDKELHRSYVDTRPLLKWWTLDDMLEVEKVIESAERERTPKDNKLIIVGHQSVPRVHRSLTPPRHSCRPVLSARPVSTAGLTPTCAAERRRSSSWVPTGP